MSSLYRRARHRLAPLRRVVTHTPATVRRMNRNDRDENALRLLMALGLRSDANCVDVGAHAGHVLRHMVSSAPNGCHVAFEALPDFAARLKREFPTVAIREVALGKDAGTAEFVRPVGLDAYAGLKPRPYPSTPPRLERFTVEVSTLDEQLDPAYKPALIKIDVEGGEHDVIQGARRVIEQHQPLIQFEQGPTACRSYGVDHADIWNLLHGFGYQIVDMDGDGPYTLDRFVKVTEAFQRFNFLATP